MKFFANLFDQLKGMWNRASGRGRLVFVAITALSVLLVSLVGFWSSRPEYVTLAQDLSPTQAAELVTKLEADGINHKLGFSGSSILVTKNQLSRSRLIAGDLIGPAASDAMDSGQSPWDDPRTTEYKLLRRQEQLLSKTLVRMNSMISDAVVHIAPSNDSLFVREVTPSKASVVLHIKPGAVFTQANAAAVAKTMAGAIEGLYPENVTVSDNRGNLLWDRGTTAHSDVAGHLQLQRNIENSKAAGAEVMLAKYLGEGHAEVLVTADIDFRSVERVEKTFDANEKITTKEKLDTTSTTESAPGGPVGTAGNIGSNPTSPKNAVTTKSEVIDATYEFPTTVDSISEPGGTIRRLSVAVMVDLSKLPEGTDVAAVRAGIENIVKTAVGFDESRDDKIAVMDGQFVGILPLDDSDALEAEKWANYGNLARNASLGIASLVALVLGILIIRKLKPQPPSEPNRDTLSSRERFLQRFAAEVRENPDAVSKILANWLGDGDVERDTIPLAGGAAGDASHNKSRAAA